MTSKKYTESEFIEAVAKSTSIAQVINRLGLIPAGGNYKTINNKIKELGLDISHLNGQGWSKGKTLTPKRDIQDYLSNKHPIQSFKLKNRLIKEGIFDWICSKCNLTVWLDKKIPLELDHINGDNSDNSLKNLRLLCPNCHAQTPTYRGKNISSQA